MSGNNNEEFRRKQQEMEIVPDTPTMRSVAIMPPPMPVMRSVQPTSLAKSAPIHVGPTINVNTNSAVSSELRPKTSPNWRVEQAKELPSFYPLERSHVRLSGVTALEVSSRIDECLRKESVAVVYDNQKAIARAETSHCLKFSVVLFQDKEQIIMEVQKTSGCCFLFNQTVKTLFSAAKSGVGEPLLSKARLPMPRSVPAIPDSAWEECTKESLDICRSQFKERRVDSHLLAVESLAQISDKSSKCRVFCAEHIMKENSDLLQAILSLIQVSRLETDESFVSELEQQQFAIIHRHAVEILSNCLEVVPSAVSTLPELTSPATLDALLLDVQSAKSKPHEAAAACKCLTLLSKICKTTLMEQDVPSLLHTAVECRHATLEEECTKLMNTLYN